MSPYVLRCARLVAEITRAHAEASHPWPLPERFCVEVIDVDRGLCLVTHSRHPWRWHGKVCAPGRGGRQGDWPYRQLGGAMCCASQTQARLCSVDSFNRRQLKRGGPPCML